MPFITKYDTDPNAIKNNYAFICDGHQWNIKDRYETIEDLIYTTINFENILTAIADTGLTKDKIKQIENILNGSNQA